MKDRNYPGAPSEKEIEKKVKQYKKKMQENNNKEVLMQLLNCVDLTSLNVSDTESKIAEMTEKVNKFKKHFPKYKNVAAICVYPAMVPTVLDCLELEDVDIAAVGACFPASQSFLSVKAVECEMAVEKGADAISSKKTIRQFRTKYSQSATQLVMRS